MARRTGVPAIQIVARRMCRLILQFSPIIRAVYPNSTALHLALDTAMAACGALEKELELVREYGD